MSRPIFSSAANRLSWNTPCASTQSFQRCQRLLPTSRTASRTSASSYSSFVSRKPTTNRASALRTTQCLRTRVPESSVFRFAAPRQRHAFSSSSARPATKVAQNPRQDDDGNDLTVTISSRAAERLRAITDPSSQQTATKDENPYHHLRITVTSGGCHGFQYLMSLESSSKIDPEEDTVFEDEDGAAGPGEAKVVMDQPSLELLSGSTVDFTTELIGSQFTISDNPRATSNCGCGTSFDVND